ncbi:hypothetical protein RUM43_003953 [Polyplax serrata]|uniref:Uncharacterized protein n=1 Tax=Polyplax serrata TaxID=468196 RepID=A0AAN8S2K3_POLSC
MENWGNQTGGRSGHVAQCGGAQTKVKTKAKTGVLRNTAVETLLPSEFRALSLIIRSPHKNFIQLRHLQKRLLENCSYNIVSEAEKLQSLKKGFSRRSEMGV